MYQCIYMWISHIYHYRGNIRRIVYVIRTHTHTHTLTHTHTHYRTQAHRHKNKANYCENDNL